VLPLFSTCEPAPMEKSVHESGIGTRNSWYDWTPDKLWLSK
jgi:hypothetical protein